MPLNLACDKYPIEKKNTQICISQKFWMYPVKIWNTQMNEEVGNILNCSKT